jgi:hypothetical protein
MKYLQMNIPLQPGKTPSSLLALGAAATARALGSRTNYRGAALHSGTLGSGAALDGGASFRRAAALRPGAAAAAAAAAATATAASELSNTGVGDDDALDGARGLGARNGESGEVAEEAGVGLLKGARVGVDVGLEGAAEARLALGNRAGGGAEEVALEVTDHDILDIIKDATLKQALAVRVTLDSVAANVAPQTIDGVEKSAAAKRRSTARRGGDVVV